MKSTTKLPIILLLLLSISLSNAQVSDYSILINEAEKKATPAPTPGSYSSNCQKIIQDAVDVYRVIHDVKATNENKKLSIDYRTKSGLYDFDFHFIYKNIGAANLATNEWGRPNLVYKWKDDEGNIEKVDVYYFPTYEDYVMFVEPNVASACAGEYESIKYSEISSDEKLFIFRKGERVEASVKTKLYTVQSNITEVPTEPKTIYYKNGYIKEVGQTLEGQKTGTWKHYYSNGELKATGTYENNQKTGTWKTYDENGQLKGSMEY